MKSSHGYISSTWRKSMKKETVKKKTNRYIDPPSGWQFGFPKIVPEGVVTPEDFKKWFIESGYPEKDIELAMTYSSSWEEDGN
jgi:hypothetical protein